MANYIHRNRSLGVLASLVLLLTACATPSAATRDPSDDAGTSMGVQASVTPAAAMPSQSAQMVCRAETGQAVATTLALPTVPSGTASWDEPVYTCTFGLPEGSLVLTVNELADVSAAHRYFEELSQTIGPAQPIVGLPSLGLPGFQTTNGTVIFVKDAMTLQVDATALPDRIGPNLVSRTDFAYQIATNILGCWTGQ